MIQTNVAKPALFGLATAAAVLSLAAQAHWDLWASLFAATATHVLMGVIAGALYAIDRLAAPPPVEPRSRRGTRAGCGPTAAC